MYRNHIIVEDLAKHFEDLTASFFQDKEKIVINDNMHLHTNILQHISLTCYQ